MNFWRGVGERVGIVADGFVWCFERVVALGVAALVALYVSLLAHAHFGFYVPGWWWTSLVVVVGIGLCAFGVGCAIGVLAVIIASVFGIKGATKAPPSPPVHGSAHLVGDEELRRKGYMQ